MPEEKVEEYCPGFIAFTDLQNSSKFETLNIRKDIRRIIQERRKNIL